MMKQQPFLPKDVEYQALRRFVKMVEASSEGSMSENMASALAEELTPRQQQVVHMYYVDQMLMRDIADTLGVNVSTVSRTLGRGRDRLRRCLRYGGRALLDALEI